MYIKFNRKDKSQFKNIKFVRMDEVIHRKVREEAVFYKLPVSFVVNHILEYYFWEKNMWEELKEKSVYKKR